MHGAGGYKPPPNALPPPPPAAPVPVGQQPPVFLPQSVPSAAAAAAAAARGVVGSGVSVTLTPAPAAHSNQHAGFNMPGRTSAAPVHQQYQQLLQQYQHPAAPTAFLQQQQQQQQAQAAAAAAAAVEHQMDNEVKTYVSVKADPIEPTRIKYTCNACQFSPKNIGLLVDHINSVHLKRKTAPSANMFAGAAAVAALARQQPALAVQAKKSKSSSNHLLGQHRPSPKSINLYKCKQCDFGCKKESDLKAHMLVSHGVQEGSSREAEKGVSTESLIAYDEKLEHGYYCTVCKYSPSSMRYLRDHIRKVHLSKYIKCPHCELKTKRKADLMKHIKRLHPETGGDNAAASVAAAAAAAGIISPGGSGAAVLQQVPQQAHQQHLQQQHHLQQQQQQQHQLQQQQQRLQLQQQALQQPPQQIQQTIQQLTQSIMSASGAGPPTQVPQQSVIPADLKTPLINLPQHPNHQHAAAPAQPATDILLNAVKSEIPITLQLQYPAAAAAAAAMPQFPAMPQMPQQPVQISLPTIDTSAILNTYTTPSTSSATLTVPSTQGQQQLQLQQQQQAGHSSGNRSATAAGGTRTTTYKKGQNIEFDDNTKVEDLIIYGSGPGQSGGAQSQPIGCSVCNYAPTSLRYLRDHIRKVHLAKTHKCTYCDLQTKRRADLVRHIQRIHEDPKRQQQQQQQGANAFR